MSPRLWLRKEFSIFIITSIIGLSSVAQAQNANRTVKRQVATVLFSTLGGAILGLSTLSFYGEPQEHTDNISLGALLGLVGGLGYVAYDASRGPAPRGSEYSVYTEEEMKIKRALNSSLKAPLIQISLDF